MVRKKRCFNNCTNDNFKPKDVIDGQPIDYLAEHLSTPLQVEQHLTLALEEAYAVGVKPVNVDLSEETLSSRVDANLPDAY